MRGVKGYCCLKGNASDSGDVEECVDFVFLVDVAVVGGRSSD